MNFAVNISRLTRDSFGPHWLSTHPAAGDPSDAYQLFEYFWNSLHVSNSDRPWPCVSVGSDQWEPSDDDTSQDLQTRRSGEEGSRGCSILATVTLTPSTFSRSQSCPWLALLPWPSAPRPPRRTPRPMPTPSSIWEPWPSPPSPVAPSLTGFSSARSPSWKVSKQV